MKSVVVRLNRYEILDLCQALDWYQKRLKEKCLPDSDTLYETIINESISNLEELKDKLFDLLDSKNL